MTDYRESQREITRIALAAAGDDGFVLAGSGAIREHGLIDRPTEDIDLFSIQQSSQHFDAAVDRALSSLRRHGYQVETVRRFNSFARVNVIDPSTGYQTDIDFGLDYRSQQPVRLSVGYVLAEEDAVGNKVAALFSRGEVRDYLDVDAIRRNSRFSDQELLDLAHEEDPGFDLSMFTQALDRVATFGLQHVADYGVDAEQLEGVKERLLAFSGQIKRGEIAKTRPERPSLKQAFADKVLQRTHVKLSEQTKNSPQHRIHPPKEGR
jgi:hypothetical protein